jgi:hypothetical protein
MAARLSTIDERFASRLEPLPAARTAPDLTGLAMMLAAGLVIGAILQHPGLDYCPNDASRWDTVYFLVTQGTYEIKPDNDAGWPGCVRCEPDPSRLTPEERSTFVKVGDRYYKNIALMPLFSTIDMVKINGKFYSSKPPLLPTILAGVVWGIEKLTHADFRTNPWFIIRTTLIVVQVVPLMLFIWLMSLNVRRLTDSPWARNFCVLAAALATYVTPWSVTLNNHVIAACSAMVTLHAAIRIWYDGRREWYWFALAGFFGAFTATTELPAALLCAAVLMAVCIRDLRKGLLVAATCAAIPVAAFFITNYLATGSLRPAYAQFGKAGGAYDYEGSYWRNPQGVDALHEPAWIYMTNIVVGHHGLFLLTPIFLISLLGALRQFKPDEGNRPMLALLTFGATAVLVWFYTFYTSESKNYGGTAQGARWLFWLAPLWLLMLPSGAEVLARRRVGRVVCCVLLGVSMVSVGFALRQPWSASWAHLLFRQFGWISY